jgi:hypothetical protein
MIINVIFLHVYKVHLLDLISIQKRMALMTVKGFPLEGKIPWGIHEIATIYSLHHILNISKASGVGEGLCLVFVYFTDYFPPHNIFSWHSLEVEGWEFPIIVVLASWWLCFLILSCTPLYTPNRRQTPM